MSLDPVPMVPAGSARFEGRYVQGFEMSSFTSHTGDHEPWWVDPRAMTGMPALERGAHGHPDVYVDADVVVAGWLSVPGRYGHMGSHQRELRVHRIIAAAPHDATRHAAPPTPRLGRPSPWIADQVRTTDGGRLSELLAGNGDPKMAEVVTPKRDLLLVLDALAVLRPDVRVAVVRGTAADSRLHLFDAIRAGLRDPDGRVLLQWDAMVDRLAALRAGSAGPVAVVILDAEEMMLDAPDEFEAAVRHLSDATLDASSAPLHVVLHTTERFGSILRVRLDRFAAEVPRLHAPRAVADDLAALRPDLHRQPIEAEHPRPQRPSVASPAPRPDQPAVRDADGVIYSSMPMLERQRRAFAEGAASADEAASAQAAIRALEAFCPEVLCPLDFGVTVACLDGAGEGVHDPDHRPEEWHRYLRARDIADELDVGPLYRDATVVEVEAVDGDAMRAAVTHLLDQSCDHRRGTALAWTEMYVAAAWLPLPGQARLGDRRSLLLDDLDGHRLALDVPLAERDGDLWVGGPLRTVGGVPLELHVYNDGALLQLRIWVRWSLWWKQDQPGRRVIDGVLDRLSEDGWRPR